VKKGDTLASIAKKTGGDADEISSFNDVEDSTLAVGATIIVPDGEVSTPVQSAVATKTTPTTPKKTHATASPPRTSATARSSKTGPRGA
jgi:LysM repeat protein